MKINLAVGFYLLLHWFSLDPNVTFNQPFEAYIVYIVYVN